MILSCPAKTFLIGEYVALDGGPSLLLSTGPRFRLRVSQASAASESASASGLRVGAETSAGGGAGVCEARASLPWHAASPAGVLYDRHREEFAEWDFHFDDPYKGRGGLGASSAQFALLYSFLNEWFSGRVLEREELEALLREYRACAWNGEGTPPSGADVVSQLTGGVTYFDGRSFSAERLEWPFTEMSFTLLRTGFKLATHEHLREGTLAPHSTLRAIVLEARKAIATSDETRLIEAVNACALVLRQAGLNQAASADLLDQMRDQHDLFWAAKGCGAMGADIVLCLHAHSRTEDVQAWARGRGLEVCANGASLSGGLEVLQEGSAR